MKVILSITILTLLLPSLAFAFGDEKYCQNFSEKKCKKGDLIIVGGIDVLKYCDFEKRSLPIKSSSKLNLLACSYIGNPRQKRK